MSGLPRWRDMPDPDKAAAAMFLWLRSRQGGPRTIRESPCLYRQHPTLLKLSKVLACNHAMTLYPHVKALPRDEWQRLHELASTPQPNPRTPDGTHPPS